MLTGLFRIMAKDGVELRKVNTKNGMTSVLNVKVVKYWTPEDKGSPWHNVTLWGSEAERYENAITHNHAVYIEGDLDFETYDQTFTLADGTEKTITRQTPSFRRVSEFRLVDVKKLPSVDDGDSTPDDSISKTATTASKSSKIASDSDDNVPF